MSNSSDTLAPIFSVRQGDHGFWAVYLDGKRQTQFYATRIDALFLGVRDAERRYNEGK